MACFDIAALGNDDSFRIWTKTRWNQRTAHSPLPYMREKEMIFVGRYPTDKVQQAFGFQDNINAREMVGTRQHVNYGFHPIHNNCHDYAARVMNQLGQ